MAEIPGAVRREIWKRDGFRCQECGIGVAGKTGCKPQTHHVKPQSAGGDEDTENLKTLCLPCHSTKDSPGHRSLFVEQGPQELPNYVKWVLWDLALDLLAYAEWIPPRRFPARDVLDWLEGFRRALDWGITLSRDALPDCPARASYEDSEPPISLDRLDAILRGVKIGWYANATQQFLDGELRKARQQQHSTDDRIQA